jgi:hypothetical protein
MLDARKIRGPERDAAHQDEYRQRQLQDRFVRLGVSDAMAQGYTDMAWAKNEGLDNGVQRTPENSTPTSFRQ